MKTSTFSIFKLIIIAISFGLFFQTTKADATKLKIIKNGTIHFNGNPKISKDCTYNGFKLYGKVKFVEAFPDIKVQIVDAFPDINVQIVDAFPDQCGRWQIVDAFADLKVQIVEAFPDIRVKYVNAFPGVNN